MKGMHRGWNPKSVLVLDGEWPSALAIVRSLGRKGLHVEVGSSRPDPLAALSKFCSRNFVYPDPLVDIDGFRKTLLEQLKRYSYSLVIPVTDMAICPLMDIRGSVEALSALAMASNESISLALSKSRTIEMAQTLGIPIPKTLIIRNIAELHSGEHGLTYPVVIKPDRSKTWMSDGRGLDLSVKYAFNAKDLSEKVSMLPQQYPVVLQEYVYGEGVGIGVLARKGGIAFSFQYRRLHEVPLTGGPSSYRISEPVDPRIASFASSLLKSLCWDGVAMIEFKRNRESGKLHLMEINGRFWGSLPLAVAAGADFPFYLVELLLHNRCDFPTEYKVGFRCRQLSREFQWLKAAIFRKREANPIIRFPSYRSILFDALRLINPAERSDTLDLWDPRPGIADLVQTARTITALAWDRVLYLQEKYKMLGIHKNPKNLVKMLRRSNAILILCSGNFIRSPFAAQFLSHMVLGKSSVSVHSSGLEARSGRQAHPMAVSKAKSLGFDLSAHFSVPITPKMVAEADIILVMEIRHLLLLRKRFTGVRRKTYLLGCLGLEDPLEVADPDSQNEAAFEVCFNQITKALEPLVRILSWNELESRGKA